MACLLQWPESTDDAELEQRLLGELIVRTIVVLLALVCGTASAQGWFTAADLPGNRLELHPELVEVDDLSVSAAVRTTSKASGAQTIQMWSVTRAACTNGGGEIRMSLIEPAQMELPPMQFTIRRRGEGGTTADAIAISICENGARRAWGGRVWR